MRTRVISALAAIVVSAVAPTAVEAAARAAPGFPPTDVLLRVLLPEEPEPSNQVTHALGDDHGHEHSHHADEPAPLDLPALELEPPELVRMSVVFRIGTGGPEFDIEDLGGPCPNPTTCDIHSLFGFRWPADEDGRVVIPFAYNDTNRRELRAVSEPTARAAVAAAMAEWSRWNSRIAFVDEGTTDARFAAQGEDGTCADGTNVVGWERFDPNVIGVATMCLDETNSVIRDADLALNANLQWQQIGVEDSRRDAFDVQSIVTHELGHWLSLTDVYSPWERRLTMFGSAKPNQTHLRTLGLGDIVGLQTAYPCGAGDLCPRDGIADD